MVTRPRRLTGIVAHDADRLSDRADGLCVPEARDETAIGDRENCPVGLDRSVRGLIEDAPHLAVALRAAVKFTPALSSLPGQAPIRRRDV